MGPFMLVKKVAVWPHVLANETIKLSAIKHHFIYFTQFVCYFCLTSLLTSIHPTRFINQYIVYENGALTQDLELLFPIAYSEEVKQVL